MHSWRRHARSPSGAFPAGGTPDLAARLLESRDVDRTNQPVLVDPARRERRNRVSAYVAQAASDGYTLLLATLSHVTNPPLQADVRWKSRGRLFRRDAATAPVVAVVPSSLKVESLHRAFVALARSKPGKLNYLMPSRTGKHLMHLNTELLQRAANMDIVAIPYKGTPGDCRNCCKGDLAFAMLPLPPLCPTSNRASLRALAVVAAKRLDFDPNVPTLAEEGLQAQVLSWYALLAPARTPGPVLDQLNHAAAQALRDPTIQQRPRILASIPRQQDHPPRSTGC